MNFSALDSIDWNILKALQDNARIANVDLAEKVNLSPFPRLARVKALEQNGFISRFTSPAEPNIAEIPGGIGPPLPQSGDVFKSFRAPIDFRVWSHLCPGRMLESYTRGIWDQLWSINS
jgi:hypothetical protein